MCRSDVLSVTLNNELDALPHGFVLVLDDFHAIHGHAVPDLLGGLVSHWPRPMHLVLISRHNPALPLASLRAQDRLAEVHGHELRFTPEESAAYLRRMRRLRSARGQRATLEQQTEGWIAGLQLASLSLRAAGNDEEILRNLSGRPEFSDYLVQEVLSRQPPAVQTFLFKTSILDQFSRIALRVGYRRRRWAVECEGVPRLAGTG